MGTIKALFSILLLTQFSACRMAGGQMGQPVFNVADTFDNHRVSINLYSGQFNQYPKWSGDDPPLPMNAAVALAERALNRSRWSNISVQLSSIHLKYLSQTLVYSVMPTSETSLKAWFYLLNFKATSKDHAGLLPVIVLCTRNVIIAESSE